LCGFRNPRIMKLNWTENAQWKRICIDKYFSHENWFVTNLIVYIKGTITVKVDAVFCMMNARIIFGLFPMKNIKLMIWGLQLISFCLERDMRVIEGFVIVSFFERSIFRLSNRYFVKFQTKQLGWGFCSLSRNLGYYECFNIKMQGNMKFKIVRRPMLKYDY
jgi:hypothetical protein